MNRKSRTIYVKVIVDWQDYEDVTDELILEDSGIYDALKDGVYIERFEYLPGQLQIQFPE